MVNSWLYFVLAFLVWGFTDIVRHAVVALEWVEVSSLGFPWIPSILILALTIKGVLRGLEELRFSPPPEKLLRAWEPEWPLPSPEEARVRAGYPPREEPFSSWDR